jgi:hypothetical protein
MVAVAARVRPAVPEVPNTADLPEEPWSAPTDGMAKPHGVARLPGQ